MRTQCNGTTKNGERCKISGTFENGYCHLHKDQFVAESSDTIETKTNVLPFQKPSSIPNQSAPETSNKTNAASGPDNKPKSRPSACVPAVLLVVCVLFLLFKFMQITSGKTPGKIAR